MREEVNDVSRQQYCKFPLCTGNVGAPCDDKCDPQFKASKERRPKSDFEPVIESKVEPFGYVYEERYPIHRFIFNKTSLAVSADDANEFEITETPVFSVPPASPVPTLVKDGHEEHIYRRFQDLFDRGRAAGGFKDETQNLIRELTNAMRDAANWRAETKIALQLERQMRQEAQDALSAALSVPEGWKLVPIEPTVEMLGAAADYSMHQNNAVCGDGYYRVMVAAAPSGPEGWQPALEAYDAGLLNDFGGGDVSWWHDYIRAELARAHDFYAEQWGSAK